jgi:catechol 2,3-dioxygenase-like lactoylglutathione lyase family enzyme
MRTLFCLLLLAALSLPLAAQAPAPVDPGIQKVVQVAIVSRDIEASVKRWAAVLGMPAPSISTTRPGNEVKELYRGRSSMGQAKLAFFRLGQVTLELIEPVGPDTSWREYLDKNGEGVQHLGFQVTDIEKATANAAALGYVSLHRGRYDKDNGSYSYVDSQKALGVVLEFLQSDPPKQ